MSNLRLRMKPIAFPNTKTETSYSDAKPRRSCRGLRVGGFRFISVVPVILIPLFFQLRYYYEAHKTGIAEEMAALDSAPSLPLGHPWHRWSNSSALPFHKALFSEFHDLATLQYLNMNSRFGTKYDKIVPMVIQRGKVLYPKASYDYLRHNSTEGKNWYRGRVLPLEKHIVDAIKLGAKLVDNQQSSNDVIHHRLSRAMEVLRYEDGYSGLPLLFHHQDYTKCNPSYPLFANSQIIDRNYCNTSWMVPEYSMIDPRHGIGNLKSSGAEWTQIFEENNERYPWSKKKKQAVWRGGSTGKISFQPQWQNITSWRQLPRVKLATLGLDHPDLLDVGYHRECCGGYGQDNFTDYGWMKQGMGMQDWMNYTAIIDVDGNSWSSRLGFLLCKNSVVIKVEPTWEQYFMEELEPWTHYVPANFSDLVDVVKYVTDDKNEGQMQGIVRNANEWCKSKLTRYQSQLEMLWILVSYVEEMEKSDPDWKRLWKEQVNGGKYLIQEFPFEGY